MTARVPIRQLQQHASELIERVVAGERVEITRNGRLIAVLGPPDPEQRVMEDLIRTGSLTVCCASGSPTPSCGPQACCRSGIRVALTPSTWHARSNSNKP
ncbi:type II toxin-antitoxin system Phd/YefM family antitoxin [Streptomyces sp. NPDC051569]|uniref:type II toxin-antitoxin system Phd/YefM family antitoxin n=1 Tax=Streptomyces sp. NPDC051569 TaxID=3365661 RepID=UPI0037AFD0E9